MELKSYFRYLGRNKAYTLINVLGFALSLAFVILTIAYTWQESRVDAFHRDADRIYIVMNKDVDGYWDEWNALAVAYWYEETFPDVESVCPVVRNGNLSVACEDRELEAVTLFTEENFFGFFSYPLVSGNPETVLDEPHEAVLSESFARRMFGTEDPVGKTLRISDSTVVVVSGVMEDWEKTVLPSADLLLRVERACDFEPGLTRQNTNHAGVATTCLKMRPGKDMNEHRQEALEMYKRKGYWIFNPDYVRWAKTDVMFLRLDKAYLFQTGQYNSILDSDTEVDEFALNDEYALRHGDKQLIGVLWVLALVILFFALFNHINLSVAQAEFRYREAATRRLVGASRLSVRLRFLAEALGLTLFSFLLALLLVFAFRPYAEDFLETGIDLSVLGSPEGIVLCLLLVLCVSLVAGWLPAGRMSAAKPIDIVNGTFLQRSKRVAGPVFIAFQAGTTFVLLSLALVTAAQVRSMLHAPLGYKTSHVMDVGCFMPVVFDGKEAAFYAALEQTRRIPGVERVGVATNLLAVSGNSMGAWYNGRFLEAYWMTMDSVAFHIMGFEVLRDNRTERLGGCFLTKRAYELMGLPVDADEVEVKQEFNGEEFKKRIPLRGMIGDMRQQNILSEFAPCFIELYDNYAEYEDLFYDLVVEFSGNPMSIHRAVKAVTEECFGPEAEIEISFLDQNVQNTFVQQIRLNKLLACFAGVALLVSVLGLVAISVFHMRQRLQEMAVRKVFGADNRQVFWHLLKPFMVCVGIGIVVGLPVAWYLMDSWLSGFSYRLSGMAWYMVLVAAFCLVVSFVALGIQGRIASRANPAENLKTE